MFTIKTDLLINLRDSKIEGVRTKILEQATLRAAKIKVFPGRAEMERKMFTTEGKIISPCGSPMNAAEHLSSVNISRFSFYVNFFYAISLCG